MGSQRAFLCLIPLHILVLLLAAEAQARSCPLGSFDNGSKCKKCAPGTFQDKVGSKSCKKCPAGTFTTATGVISGELCLECPRDSNSKPGSRKCTKCPRGKVRNCAKCMRCPAGTYLAGCRGCEKCSPDTFSAKANQDDCMQCPPGMRSKPDGTGCRAGGCPPGFQYDGSCEPCNSAYFRYRTFKNEKTGLCESCPPRTTILDFSKPAVKCEKCPPGEFLTDIIVTTDFQVPVCEKCPPGTTTRGFGKPLCRAKGKPCPANTFVDKDGDCQGCDPDFRFDPKNKRCVECKRNEILPGIPDSTHIQTKCKKCRRGERRVFGRCVCRDGESFRRGRCRPCPAGTYSYSGEKCESCGPEEFSGTGATECKPCPDGSLSIKSKGKKCKRLGCPKKFIAPSLVGGSVFPVDVCISRSTGCPEGLVGLGFKEGSFLCGNKKGKVVCPKRYIFDKKNRCISCSEGFKLVTTAQGTLDCDLCPTSKPVSPGGLSRKCMACMKGFTPDGFGECICPRGRFVRKNGRCVKCPPSSSGDKAPKECQ